MEDNNNSNISGAFDAFGKSNKTINKKKDPKSMDTYYLKQSTKQLVLDLKDEAIFRTRNTKISKNDIIEDAIQMLAKKRKVEIK